MISPGKITREEFNEALGRYPALIKSISISKTPAKEGQGQLTLEELDEYRFEEAPTRYYKTRDLQDPKAVPAPLSHADVTQLVRWKLKHGTFRPNLLKLAESNSPDDIETTTVDAFTTYKKDSFNPSKAIMKLTTLRGIGPATASLLLSVHDAARIPFFSDELYLWICHDGAKATIKYSLKEYEELVTESRRLIDAMGVDARDVEKVAFVLIKEAGSTSKKPAAAAAEINGTSTSAVTKKAPVQKEKKAERSAPKPPREPTDMTEERKAQLQEIAERARAARMAKRSAKEASKLAKGTKFRERIDAARERKKDEPSAGTPVKAGVKRKSEVTTRGLASSAKRSKKSEAK